MCVNDGELQQVASEMESPEDNSNNQPWGLHCELLHTQMDTNWDAKDSAFLPSTDDGIAGVSVPNFFPMESICEDRVSLEKKQSMLTNFVPVLRTGEWSDIGERSHMEDTHICIGDLAKKFGFNLQDHETVSFYGTSEEDWKVFQSKGSHACSVLEYGATRALTGLQTSTQLSFQEAEINYCLDLLLFVGIASDGNIKMGIVFDGHGGKGASQFVRDHLPRVIVQDADFPLELEKVVTRSFIETDVAFEKSCSLQSTLSSGTTALTAMIFGRSLLVANAGDCRAVLSRHGIAVEMSSDHKPCCIRERARVESLGGYVDDGYLNGQLSVTRALGDWHIEGMKEEGEKGGPLSAEPELKLITLTKEDEFLIIGSDGIWDMFSSQNAVDFSRRRLQEHNDVKLCCKEMVEEAIRRGASDNLTVVLVSFHLEPPPQVVVKRGRVRRSISAEGLQNLRYLLQE